MARAEGKDAMNLNDYAKGQKETQLRKQRTAYLYRAPYPTIPSLEQYFLGKLVIVEAYPDIEVLGKLIYFRDPLKFGHIPLILIVENIEGQRIIIRNYRTVKTLRKEEI